VIRIGMANKVNPDSTRQVNRYIKEYSKHIWDNELTGDTEFVLVRDKGKNKRVRSRSKNGKYYYPYPSYEGGKETIGPGFKLNDNSVFTKKVLEKGKVTREEIDVELSRRMAKSYNDVRDIYSERYGVDSFNSLPQPVVNLMSNLAYRVGRRGFRQYKRLLENVNKGNIDGIIKEYNTGNKGRDKSELDLFKNANRNDYDVIRNNIFSNFNLNVNNPDNFVEVMNGTTSVRKKRNFGGVMSKRKYTERVTGVKADSWLNPLFYSSGKSDKTGLPIKNKVDELYNNDVNTFVNMQNKINSEIISARGINRCGGLARKRMDFGGVRKFADYLYKDNSIDNRFPTLEESTARDKTVVSEQRYAKEFPDRYNRVSAIRNNDIATFANMQNKINNEILTARGVTNEVKLGGLVGKTRRKFYWGGTSINDPGSVQWGTKVRPSDISHSEYTADGEGIVGGSAVSGATTGLGIGATVGAGVSAAAGGAASGALMGAWGGPIVAGIGALIGGIVGLFTGRKKKRQEEARRKELLAQQAEMERQQTLGNMQDKVESDVAAIRQSSLGNYSEGTGFYAKMGGMIGRKKLSNGGQVIPNSSNTLVAYGQTHEQYNPLTGSTGIDYGDSEIEGGGVRNGKMYAGEVVRETPEGGQVFSDTLKVPGTNQTFADYAKKLTDMKGKKEAQVIKLGDGITLSLQALDSSKTNKLRTGTNVRNIEKLTYKMNKARGESEFIDSKTEDLFEAQELYATALGLRSDEPIMRCGGIARKKPYGGIAEMARSGYGVYKPNYTINVATPTISAAPTRATSGFGFMETGLAMNLAGSAFGIIGNALNARANRKAIEFEQGLHVPKSNKVEATRYSTDYDISQELQELATRERRVSRYITDNTSNVQTARNSISKLAIDAQLARNQLYGQKKDYQRQRYDMNLQERTAARNANNQLMYQDAINEYNKAVGLNQQMMAVRTQGLQGMLEGVNNIAGAYNNYASGKLYEKMWRPSVRNYVNGFRCGGLVRRKKRK
jgi:hypothetical protein